jgi:hypothetical protein
MPPEMKIKQCIVFFTGIHVNDYIYRTSVYLWARRKLNTFKICTQFDELNGIELLWRN